MDGTAEREDVILWRGEMATNRWVMVLRGLIALLFGYVAVTNTVGTAVAIYLWFAFFAVADGLIGILVSLGSRGAGLWRGVVSAAAGVLALAFPNLTALFVLYVIATRAIIDGVFQLGMGRGWRTVGGILSILFGLWMLFHPALGGLALLWVIGLYAFVYGVLEIVLAFAPKPAMA